MSMGEPMFEVKGPFEVVDQPHGFGCRLVQKSNWDLADALDWPCTPEPVVRLRALCDYLNAAHSEHQQLEAARAAMVEIQGLAMGHYKELNGCPGVCGNCVACNFIAIENIAARFLPVKPPESAVERSLVRAAKRMRNALNYRFTSESEIRNVIAEYDAAAKEIK